MVTDQPTRVMVKRLRSAGFAPNRTVGSHTWWKHRITGVQVSVPDGHRTISPGVVRKIDQAIKESARAEREGQ